MGKRNLFLAVLSTLVVSLAVAGPAAAHHKPGHDGGKGKDKHASSEAGDTASVENGSQGKDTKDKGAKGDKPDKGSKGGGKKDAPITSGAPGNNGTIKIDGEPFDTTKGNEPHVGCTFRVLYWGFDEGPDLTSTLTFVAHAPTRGPMTFTDTITLGAGEPDVAGPYNLVPYFEAAGIEPHPKQGWHVKLTTNSEYSQGADTKHKVFWIKCNEEVTPVPDTAGQSSATETEGDDVKGVTLNRPGSGADSDDVSGDIAPAQRDAVLASGAESETSGGVLPFTGGAILTYVLIGAALIAAGFFVTRFRRRSA